MTSAAADQGRQQGVTPRAGARNGPETVPAPRCAWCGEALELVYRVRWWRWAEGSRIARALRRVPRDVEPLERALGDARSCAVSLCAQCTGDIETWLLLRFEPLCRCSVCGVGVRFGYRRRRLEPTCSERCAHTARSRRLRARRRGARAGTGEGRGAATPRRTTVPPQLRADDVSERPQEVP